MPRPSASAAVLIFITILTKALTWAALPASPTKRKLMLKSSSKSFTELKTSSCPPIIKYRVPSRAWVMLEAIQPSRVWAPISAAAASRRTWSPGERVAQLINNFPEELENKLSASLKKIDSMAASLVTTVRMISEWAVTSVKDEAACEPSSSAREDATLSLMS